MEEAPANIKTGFSPSDGSTGVTRASMVAMLQRDPTSQRLYAHDVVIAEEPTSKTAGRHLSTNRAGSSGDSLFITNILQNALSVKNEISNSRASAKTADRRPSERKESD